MEDVAAHQSVDDDDTASPLLVSRWLIRFFPGGGPRDRPRMAATKPGNKTSNQPGARLPLYGPNI